MIDVAIIGGGPAGCACALSLRAHAPSLSVVVFEASRYDVPRIGETLPPAARPMLEHLSVWNAFVAHGHREVHGTAAAWGASLPADNDFIFHARGAGWHLDRAAFDAMLAREAAHCGVAIRHDAVRDAEAIGARFIVDATGGSARFARRFGARFVDEDRLLGFARFFNDAGRDDPRTVVEAFADGWWYTAGLPDGRRVAACMTDADLAREMRLEDPDHWMRALDAMPVTRSLMRDAHASGPIVVRPSHSRRLEPSAGENWLAVGDAASTFDPLSSQGILKALRSGVFASYAIGDFLTRDDDTGLHRYRAFIRDEFAGYLATRAKYYAEERRWPESAFWRRRQSSPLP